jgi:hypothetical protein
MVNPSEWRDRMNMTVRVGLGSGNRDKQVEGLQLMLEIQKQMKEMGVRLVNEQNIYNTLERLVEILGLKDASTYFTDPSRLPPPEPPKPNPLEVAQVQLANAQAQSIQAQTMVQNKEADTNRQEALWRHEEKLKELDDKDLRERTKMELEFQKNVPGALT